jgi:hypothetical protein
MIPILLLCRREEGTMDVTHLERCSFVSLSDCSRAAGAVISSIWFIPDVVVDPSQICIVREVVLPRRTSSSSKRSKRTR